MYTMCAIDILWFRLFLVYPCNFLTYPITYLPLLPYGTDIILADLFP